MVEIHDNRIKQAVTLFRQTIVLTETVKSLFLSSYTLLYEMNRRNFQYKIPKSNVKNSIERGTYLRMFLI